MSRPRTTILFIAACLTGLVVNSAAAYAMGLTPAIFDGVMFYALLVTWGICWLAYVLVTPAERRDRRERTRNFSTAIHYWDGHSLTDSGSWRRPPLN